MSDGIGLIMFMAVMFVFWCMLLFANDVVKAIYHQFVGDEYRWYTITLMKEKRGVWGWIIAILVFCVGVYWLLPGSLVGKEDFRASKQKPGYTAYYKCKYDVDRFGVGDGYVSIVKDHNGIRASKLYTDGGWIQLDLEMDRGSRSDSYISQCIGSDCYASIDIGDGPIGIDSLSLNANRLSVIIDGVECDGCGELIPEEYAYITESKTTCPRCLAYALEYVADPYVWKCERCCKFYDGGETDLSGYCPDCELSHGKECANCGRYAAAWGSDENEFVLCEFCLMLTFDDDEIKQTALESLEN